MNKIHTVFLLKFINIIFSSREILNNHRERCLLINDTQAVKYETGIVKFKNYEKQIPIPFKIYADTECNIDNNQY